MNEQAENNSLAEQLILDQNVENGVTICKLLTTCGLILSVQNGKVRVEYPIDKTF